MKPTPQVEREPLARDADGLPWSARYGDIYASRAGALGQARAVFLGGCGLLGADPAWAGKRQFVVLEAGFGLGTNFLATWQAWRADPQRPHTLHYVGIELHPVAADDLIDACADPSLIELARELAAQWPPARHGLHPIHLDDGRVRLLLAFGDCAAMLRQLELGADAIYLDGFAPSRNPDMWQAAVLKGLAKLARPGAALASYTVARPVCDGLRSSGFVVDKPSGWGGKAQRLQARYAPGWEPHHRPRQALAATAARQAIVIGAGLAGAATAAALSRRGWQVRVLEADAAAAGASGLAAGLAHLRVAGTADDRLARLTRSGLAWLRLALPDPGLLVDDGVLMAGPRWPDPTAATAATTWPAELAKPLDGAALARAAGVAHAPAGWWTCGGTVACANLVRAWLDRPGVQCLAPGKVDRLQRGADGLWQALDASGQVLAQAPTLVVACALESPRLLQRSGLLPSTELLPMRAQAGQGFVLPAASIPDLQTLRRGLMANAYVLPLPHAACTALGLATNTRWLFVGATYENDPEQPLPADQVWRHIAAGLLPLGLQLPAAVPADARLFRGVRAVAHGRLPVAGPCPDWQAEPDRQGRRPSQPGLYLNAGLGSRGLTLAALGADIIASHAEGEPAPLELDLLRALDPGRYAA